MTKSGIQTKGYDAEPVDTYHQYMVKDTVFTVLERYEILDMLRSDSYGVVVAAKDTKKHDDDENDG